MTESKICIDLSQEEALVLHDWLYRFNKIKDKVFDDQAEQRVLWDVEAILESRLDALFDPQYDKILKTARAKVRDKRG